MTVGHYISDPAGLNTGYQWTMNQFPEQKKSNNLDIIFQAVAVAGLNNLNIDHENAKDWCVVCVCVCVSALEAYTV